MQNEGNFRQITHMFYNGDYKEGEKELTALIEKNSSNAMLLVNRGIFLSQMGED